MASSSNLCTQPTSSSSSEDSSLLDKIKRVLRKLDKEIAEEDDVQDVLDCADSLLDVWSFLRKSWDTKTVVNAVDPSKQSRKPIKLLRIPLCIEDMLDTKQSKKEEDSAPCRPIEKDWETKAIPVWGQRPILTIRSVCKFLSASHHIIERYESGAGRSDEIFFFEYDDTNKPECTRFFESCFTKRVQDDVLHISDRIEEEVLRDFER